MRAIGVSAVDDSGSDDRSCGCPGLSSAGLRRLCLQRVGTPGADFFDQPPGRVGRILRNQSAAKGLGQNGLTKPIRTDETCSNDFFKFPNDRKTPLYLSDYPILLCNGREWYGQSPNSADIQMGSGCACYLRLVLRDKYLGIQNCLQVRTSNRRVRAKNHHSLPKATVKVWWNTDCNS